MATDPIALYIPYVDSQATGMQRFASQMVLAFERAGVPVNVIIGEQHGTPAWLEDMPHSVLMPQSVVRWLPRPLVAIVRIAWLQFIFPFTTSGRSASSLVALAHELAPYPLFRQVAVAHDLTSLKSFGGRGGVGIRVRTALWRLGLKRSQAVIAISEATCRDVQSMFGIDREHIQVIHEGVDRSVFYPRVDGSVERDESVRPFFLYVGTLDPHKNVALLIDVFQRLRQRVGEVELKLVGRYKPAQASALLDHVSEIERASIHLLGFVDDDELATLLSRCTAFVFPSRNEGFGLAVVEAMACGAPVISSDAGSLPEVVGNGGVLLSPDDLDAWVAELMRLLADEEYRLDLSERAIERSKVFSWDDAARAYDRLLQES